MHDINNGISIFFKKFNVTPNHFSGDGTQAITDCPFCGKEDHFYINNSNGLWICHHCGKKGNQLSFIEMLLPSFQKSFFGTPEIQLASNRHLKPETLRSTGIGYNPQTGEYIIPAYKPDGKLHTVYTCKLINGKLSKPFCLKGFPTYLYGLEKLNADKVYLCEGIWDMLAMRELGLCTVAVPGANTIKQDWAKHFTGKSIYIVYDNDEAGRNGIKKVVGLLRNVAFEIKHIKWPAGKPAGYDVRDLYIQHGSGTLDILQSYLFVVKIELPISNQVVNSDDNIHAVLFSITQNKNLTPDERHQQCGEAVREWLRTIGTFYHTPDNDFSSAMFFNSALKVLFLIQNDNFLSWLSDTLRVNRASKLFSFILKDIENEALSDRAKEINVSLYWAKKDGKIYLSCGPNKIVRISADTIETVDNGTDGILFTPFTCLHEWTFTDPVDPFDRLQLFQNLSTVSPHARMLLKLWFISCPTNPLHKPVLVIIGPVGSGKTCIIRNIFHLFGMSQNALCPKEREGEQDFWVVLNFGGIALVDNVDSHIKWLPDNIAVASTGTPYKKRKLYTNDAIASYYPHAWITLTSANPLFASDAGLADRALVIRLERLVSDTADASLTLEIRNNRDGVMSWLCTILKKALADNKPVPQGLNKRHPDFADFAVRIGRALGEEEAAIKALKAAEADKGMVCLQNDSLGSILLDIHNTTGFKGTASELLDLIRKKEGIGSYFYKISAKQIGVRIGRIWAHIEKVTGATKLMDRTRTTVYHIPELRKKEKSTEKTSCKIPKTEKND